MLNIVLWRKACLGDPLFLGLERRHQESFDRAVHLLFLVSLRTKSIFVKLALFVGGLSYTNCTDYSVRSKNEKGVCLIN